MKEGAEVNSIKARIQAKLGDSFEIADRYEQEKEFLRLMKVEKWLAFLMLSLAAMLVAFNMIGALWMIVIDKKKDISILKCIGFNNEDIRNIFLTLGAYIAGLGILIGSVLTLIIYYLQVQFGIVGVPEGTSITAYPVELSIIDFILTAVIILCIGMLASVPAALRAKKVPSIYRIEG